LIASHWRPIALVFIASIVFFANLGSSLLFDEDEPKNAACGREMLERGDWLVPTFNHELRPDKPILLYWFMLVSYSVLGVSEFSARLASAVLATGTVVLTYHLARILFDRTTALLAGVILASGLMFSLLARAATPDSTLIFFTTLAMFLYVWAVARENGGRFPSASNDGDRSWRAWVPSSPLLLASVYAAMSTAVLAKGPVGVVLPGGIIAIFLMVMIRVTSAGPVLAETAPRWKRALAECWWLCDVRRWWAIARCLRPMLAIGVLLVIAVPWYVAVGVMTEGAWLQGFLGGHNVGRVMQPMENHSGPIFYYVVAILVGLFPWSVFLPVAIVRFCKGSEVGGSTAASRYFVLCWAGTFVGFFSLAATKLPNYVVPCYPALAIITAYFLQAGLEAADVKSRGWFRVGLGSLGACGLLIGIALIVVGNLLLPGEQWLAVVGLAPLVGAGLAYTLSRRGMQLQAIGTATAACVLFIAALHTVVSPRISEHQEAPYFAEVLDEMHASGSGEARVATHEYFAPNLVFYGLGRVEQPSSREEAEAFLAAGSHNFLVVPEPEVEELELGADVEVLARHRRFLRQYDMVLLGRQPTTMASTPQIRR